MFYQNNTCVLFPKISIVVHTFKIIVCLYTHTDRPIDRPPPSSTSGIGAFSESARNWGGRPIASVLSLAFAWIL
jgi:hypothetical protein